ncbi:MAG: metal-dependent transcriptional regulator [Actinomycetota bacterium]
MSYEPQEHHPAFEEYSETIYELNEDGIAVIQARIAERLDVSRPAVSEMIQRMSREGLVKIEAGGEIRLTAAGTRLASTIVRRHRLAERFLTDILELNWREAHEEAGRWEHVISPTVEAAMLQTLGDPTTCPHGNPIPGSDYVEPVDARPLASIEPDDDFTVIRIPEELEFVDGQLDFLEKSGLMPGLSGSMISVGPDGTTTVHAAGKPVGLAANIAESIVVVPA